MKSQASASAHWHEHMYRWLSAPLLLTVIGAFLINYMIPEITAKSQRSKEALEIKASLVQDMTEATTAAVGVSRLVATDVIKKEEVEEPRRNAAQQAAFNHGLQNWEVQSANLGSRLEAFFPTKTSGSSAGSQLASDWREFATAVSDVYFLSSTGLKVDRQERIARVQGYLSQAERSESKEFWQRISAGDLDTGRNAAYRSAYADLGNNLLVVGGELVRRVLDGDVSGF